MQVLIVYAQDWPDLADLRHILRKLHEIGLAQDWVHFKRDRETLTGHTRFRVVSPCQLGTLPRASMKSRPSGSLVNV